MRRFGFGLGLPGEQGGEGIHHELNRSHCDLQQHKRHLQRLKTVVQDHCVSTLPQHLAHIPTPARRKDWLPHSRCAVFLYVDLRRRPVVRRRFAIFSRSNLVFGVLLTNLIKLRTFSSCSMFLARHLNLSSTQFLEFSISLESIPGLRSCGEQPPLMVTIEMSSLSENHLLAAILANVRMITAVQEIF